MISATWKDLLSASTLFWVTVNRPDGRVMVQLLEGSLASELQQNDYVFE